MSVYKIWWSEKVSYRAYVKAGSLDEAIETPPHLHDIVRDAEIVGDSLKEGVTAELVCEGDLCDCNCGGIGIVTNISDDGNMLVSCPECIESAIKKCLEHR